MANHIVIRVPALPALGAHVDDASVALVDATNTTTAAQAAAPLLGIDPHDSAGVIVFASLGSAHTRIRATGTPTYGAVPE